VTHRWAGSGAGFYRGLMSACGVAAFAVGGWWIFKA
jgi:hypothetical protein